jgi:hypothetical protein
MKFKVPLSDDQQLAAARRRVAKMGTNELLNWADVAGSGMAKGFSDYRREGDVLSLDEIHLALISLTAVTDELIIRGESENA